MFSNCKNGLKIITISSLLLAATSFVKPDAAVALHFSRTCPDRSIGRVNGIFMLAARCTKGDGTLGGPTALNLSSLIGVNLSNGSMVWRRPGRRLVRVERACSYPRLVMGRYRIGGGQYQAMMPPTLSPTPGAHLVAWCINGQRRGAWKKINLDPVIGNNNGELTVGW